METSFGERLESIPWERMDGFSRWALAFMAPDGSTIDFGDAWAKRGWGTFMPVLAHMAAPDALELDAEPDPCFAHKFYSNKYYYHGLTDPWKAHPALARDWPSIVGACDDIDGMLPEDVEVEVWSEGGWGSVRVGMPGMTDIAASLDSDAPSRFRQADQVMLAISAIPNSASHTEMDFGTVVWVPYGSRIIADFGYGSLHGNRYETAPEHPPDQNPTGHSTLIIPEALLDGDPSTNTSQIDGRDGTITMEEIDGHATLLLDGSAVYGRDDPELGWLEHFHRRVVPLDSGHIILIDDFTVRDDRPDASVSEYWYTHPWEPGFDADDCLHQDKWVDRLVGEHTLDLIPACSGLENTASSPPVESKPSPCTEVSSSTTVTSASSTASTTSSPAHASSGRPTHPFGVTSDSSLYWQRRGQRCSHPPSGPGSTAPTTRARCSPSTAWTPSCSASATTASPTDSPHSPISRPRSP